MSFQLLNIVIECSKNGFKKDFKITFQLSKCLLLSEVFRDLPNVTSDFGSFSTDAVDDAMSALKVNLVLVFYRVFSIVIRTKRDQ